MIYRGCNGTVMLSSESEVVKNNVAYSQLEKYLITLSAKYGLGEVLFRERNPRNNNSTDSFYIRAPKDWSIKKIFEVWDCIIEDSDEFIESRGYDSELELCDIVVSGRY
ncbi:hypothetical protein [Methanobrevibacter sp.]|uniref:hypothetical protein n=1 Tax=Methanobrevibacter sp. TaxID=66852 RepID=UPI0025FB4822|nr:hypothetical protein [Methanobrevibacter sp.]MBQ6099990.1 hypothetical protein [Methanobrevibacter sp.]MBQ6512716.1 hypothetical protein [Methanobrevibacter sp.]